LDQNDNLIGVSHAIPLALSAISRAPNPLDPIPRKDIISWKKLLAEGTMEESKCILGWIVNTISLSISFPWDKYKNWSDQLSSLISSKRASTKELETLIGRLNHCALILPAM
jgi:hypothetical protein